MYARPEHPVVLTPKRIPTPEPRFDNRAFIFFDASSVIVIILLFKCKYNTMAYSDKVIDHYENPRNVGSFAKDEEGVGTGMVGAPACGDVMKLQIKVDKEGIIVDAKFKTYGCGSAIASSSLVTELVKGMSIDQAAAIKNSDIATELALPPVKIHCSILAEDAIKAAVADYKAKNESN